MIIQNYKQLVKKLRRNKSSEYISNGQKNKVLIAINELIRDADKEISIYSGSLNKEIWEDESVKEYLSNFAGKLRILVDKKPEENTYNKYTKKLQSPLEDLGHFLTIDNTGFRLEKNNIADEDHDKATAIICFNDISINECLKSKFNENWRKAQSL